MLCPSGFGSNFSAWVSSRLKSISNISVLVSSRLVPIDWLANSIELISADVVLAKMPAKLAKFFLLSTVVAPNISSGWSNSIHCRLQNGVISNSPLLLVCFCVDRSSRTTRSLVLVGTLSLTPISRSPYPWSNPRASSWANRRSNQTSMALSSSEAAPCACSERTVIRRLESSIEARVGMGKTCDWIGMSVRNTWVSMLYPFRSV
mmetsp:Transcript_30258/g.64904  ORF Transcript_30258/g.64904 Transcript_30258/m.64904 type:complete len:205 (+) Transcript_30258:2409-3023(+)